MSSIDPDLQSSFGFDHPTGNVADIEDARRRLRGNLSPVKTRILDTAVLIGEDLPDRDTLGYLHATLAMCSLPFRRPDDTVRRFERRNGRASLLLTAGHLSDPQTGQWIQQGLPFGPKARLLLIHLCSEALRTQDRVIDVGRSMSFFMRSLGIEPIGGPRGSIRPFKEQFQRLAATRMQLGFVGDQSGTTIDAQPIKGLTVWFPDDPRQRMLWSSTVVLDSDFFESLRRHAVPLDPRAIEALKHNALALDIYTWLAHRLHRIRNDKGDFVPWTSLYEQFGEGYARLIDFRRKFADALRQATAVYPGAKIEETGKGLRLFESRPPVAPRILAVSGGR